MKKEIIQKLEKLSEASDQRLKNAALIEKDGKIIKAVSNKKGIPDPTGHAEIKIIRAVCKHLNTKSLEGYSLYVLYEPCDMCLNVIASANIENVYFVYSINEEERNIIREKRQGIKLKKIR